MPRFTLQQFSPTDYRGSLPERDPNNAIWPRISAFAKMLHDISWEDDDEYDDGTGRSEKERAADFENNSRENMKTSEDRKMDGYPEYLNDQSRLTEDEKKTQAAEQQLEYERERKQQERESESRTSTDMGRQAEIAENNQSDMEQFIRNFDPNTASKEEIRQMQRIVAPTDAKLSDPDDKPSRSYFDDADWGEASQKAFEDYLKQWGYQ
jgi:hypothetical protein